MQSLPAENIIQFHIEKPVTPCASALSSFLNVKTAEQKSPGTIKDYRRFVRQFFRLYPAAWDSPAAMRASFLNWIAQPDIAPATYNLRLIYLRAFWHWCVDEEIQPPRPDPFRGIKRRPDRGSFRDIDASKVKELLSLPDRRTWIGLRDYALILFTLDTAARPGEALQLIPADFDLSSLMVTIPASVAKTRRQRIIPFSPSTAAVLNDLALHRPSEWKDTAPFFASISGHRLGVDHWNDRLRHYRLKDGFTFKPYDLRHAACTLHLRAGMNGETLQRLMGHSTPTMTQRYIHLTNDDLRKAQALTSPVEALVPRGKRAPTRIE